MDELISIIVPVYNVEQYLDACIQSIIDQTYENIEIILVNDGSTDNSGKICDSYKKNDVRVKVIHKENGGLSDARNKGIFCAKGSYIIFIDSDDLVSNNFVEYLYQLLIDNSANIAICDLIHGSPGKEIVFKKETEKKIYTSESAIVEMLYQKSFLISACGKIFKKEYFDNIQFPYRILFEDSAIMCQIFDKAQKIVYGNAKLYVYMHREGSITTRNFSKEDCDILTICNEITNYMSERNIDLQKAARSYLVTANLRIFLNAPDTIEFQTVIEASKTAIINNWLSVFKDKKIRNKLRIALILFLFGKKIMKFIYTYVDRWS